MVIHSDESKLIFIQLCLTLKMLTYLSWLLTEFLFQVITRFSLLVSLFFSLFLGIFYNSCWNLNSYLEIFVRFIKLRLLEMEMIVCFPEKHFGYFSLISSIQRYFPSQSDFLIWLHILFFIFVGILWMALNKISDFFFYFFLMILKLFLSWSKRNFHLFGSWQFVTFFLMGAIIT